MAFNKTDRADSMKRKGGMRRKKKVCVFWKRQCYRLQRY